VGHDRRAVAIAIAGLYPALRAPGLAPTDDGLDGLRRFLEDMWASSHDVARRIVEAEQGVSASEGMERAG